jgi:hypothetical protein
MTLLLVIKLLNQQETILIFMLTKQIIDVYFHVHIKVNLNVHLVSRRTPHIIRVNEMQVIKRKHVHEFQEVNMHPNIFKLRFGLHGYVANHSQK